MVNFVIYPDDNKLIDNSDNSRFVSAKFSPKSFYIGEFSHFGNPYIDEDNLYDDWYAFSRDDLDFADSLLYNQHQDVNDIDWTSDYSEYETNIPEETTDVSTPTQEATKKISTNRKKVKGYSEFQKYYDKVEKYNPYAAKYRNLLTEIAYLESTYRPWITNNIGAAGYFQFITSTRKSLMRSIHGPLDLKSFLNNPELQINAAVYLAKSFEDSFTAEDRRIATQKGHTIEGLISGAWLGGVGGVRRYLHRGRNSTDGGTTVGERIRIGDTLHINTRDFSSENNNKSLTLDVNSAKQTMQYLPNFNIKKSNPSQWTKKSPTSSGHNCGKAVRLYIEALGIPTNGHPTYGGDYGPFLLKTGWNQISPDSEFQFGDVCVTKGQGKNKEGHISMYNGQQWVSDYIQNSPFVYSWAKAGTNTNFYRYGV